MSSKKAIRIIVTLVLVYGSWCTLRAPHLAQSTQSAESKPLPPFAKVMLENSPEGS